MLCFHMLISNFIEIKSRSTYKQAAILCIYYINGDFVNKPQILSLYCVLQT